MCFLLLLLLFVCLFCIVLFCFFLSVIDFFAESRNTCMASPKEKESGLVCTKTLPRITVGKDGADAGVPIYVF